MHDTRIDDSRPGAHLPRTGASVLGLLLIASSTLFALGERQNIRGVGMGRTFVATARGMEAAGLNPANLALGQETFLSIGIAPMGFRFGGDVLTYGVYKTFFTGEVQTSPLSQQHLEDANKELILSRFENGFGNSYGNIDARLLGVSLRIPDAGVLAFTINDYAGATFVFPEDLARFILYGNPLGSEHDFSRASLSASWMRAYGLSFGSALIEPSFLRWMTIGGGVKFIHGYAYYGVVRSNTTLSTSEYGVLSGDVDFLARVSESSTLRETGFDLFPAPAGTGWGFDVGISAGITRYLSIGVSMTDIGEISWFENTNEVFTDTTFVIDSPVNSNQQDFLLTAIAGGQSREVGSFSVPLPTTLRAGFALALHETPLFSGIPGELILGADFHKTLYAVPGFTTNERISIGSEYSPVEWLPLRAGVSIGGTAGTHVAVGFGFRVGFLAVDVASEDALWLFKPSSATQGSLSVGATLQF